ncbi:MAG: 3'(2'),5'-bisphosphate nucleotidase CysQ [candidate division Zixibacteria bacterium]|nr:3'(2'),5'-bisphosphate nucleotidase CysQ [candidate division Zixibacteria bacterium]
MTNDIVKRIITALEASREVLTEFTPGRIASEDKGGGDPVTEADCRVNELLLKLLPRDGEGWLSEETVDDLARLRCSHVWIVDPLDGTREFVAGIPEWSVSIGYVINGEAVAGGICNPQTGETVIGALGQGVLYNGKPATTSPRNELSGASVLASRSEVRRGEWEQFRDTGLEIVPTGSVAYKLGRVAVGQADLTWTLSPKNEWDIAAGVALVRAAGGFVATLDGTLPSFNNRRTLITGLVAGPEALRGPVESLLRPAINDLGHKP